MPKIYTRETVKTKINGDKNALSLGTYLHITAYFKVHVVQYLVSYLQSKLARV